MRAVALTLFSFFLLLGVSYAHVALTYPLPRKINYDFMDNFRTPEPCGGQHKGRPVLTATIIVEKKNVQPKPMVLQHYRNAPNYK